MRNRNKEMQDNKMIKVYLEGVEEERMRYKI